MIEHLTPNTQAILLLTAPLIAGRGESNRTLLSLSEYNRLGRLLREQKKEPADLLAPDAGGLLEIIAQPFGRDRLEALLARGFLLSQAVERWHSRAIWVISRADTCYPRRFKTRLKEDAPPLLYGCGEIGLLDKGGLAVVGSRHVDDDLIRYTENIGRLATEAHQSIVSGGASGIDRASMHGALQAGGEVVGVMADSLEKAALARDNRESLMEGRLVLVSPYDPAAGFNVGHAMQRNKLIYALADAGLVVTSDFKKGGTWAGAIEQLEKYRFGPLFICNGSSKGNGNTALLQHGGMPWPEPCNGEEFLIAMAGAKDTLSLEPRQESMEFRLREEPTPSVKETGSASVEADLIAAGSMDSSTPAEKLMAAVSTILFEALKKPMTDQEVAEILDVSKAQAKAWLTELAKSGKLEKLSKPVRFRAAGVSYRLL